MNGRQTSMPKVSRMGATLGFALVGISYVSGQPPKNAENVRAENLEFPNIGGSDNSILPDEISLSNEDNALWYALITVGGLTILFALCLFVCSSRSKAKTGDLEYSSPVARSLSRGANQGPHVSLPRGLARPQARTTSLKESRTQNPTLDGLALETAAEFITSNSGRKEFPVIRVHVKASSDEMNLVPGDRCVLLRVFPDGWAEGVSMRAGGPSMFPVICLGGSVPRVLAAKYNAAAPAPRPYGRPMAPPPNGAYRAGPSSPTYGGVPPTRSNTQMSNDSIGPPPSESDVPRLPSISPSESVSMRAVQMNPVDPRYLINAPPLPGPPNTPLPPRVAGASRRNERSQENLRGQGSGDKPSGQRSTEKFGGSRRDDVELSTTTNTRDNNTAAARGYSVYSDLDGSR
ncbi:hypothetical protein BC832DRAFT_613916 [Gaertneriomyces semiglobifer]|nr:hypothetical protein BC832DRAFT_613916 [Gaertneriomyces semiglobifer]